MNAVVHLDEGIIASLVTNGDLSRLSPSQKVAYYNYRCSQAGLDPAAKPFDLLRLNGKEILYANATCTQQLCATRKLSLTIVSRERIDDTYIVHARVTDAEGRSTDNMGAVPLSGLKGEALSNAMMKATTKASRRTVLAHCGLGMLDETETSTIPNAQPVAMPAAVPLVTLTVENPLTVEEAMQALIDHGSSDGFIELVAGYAARVPDPDGFKAQARALFKEIREREQGIHGSK